MPTNREVYFSKLPIVKKSRYLTVPILNILLIKINNFKDELELTKNFDKEIKDLDLFEKMFNAIQKGRMFEYVINESLFDGNKFFVDENVLIPRQETEELVKRFYEYFVTLKFDSTNANIADVCTGSGCVGISIKKRFSESKVILTDIDDKALEVASKNVKLNDVECQILKGDMLNPLLKNKTKLDCIICNPPYIESKKTIDERTWKQEPHKALMANPNTKFYERLFSKVSKVVNDRYLIALEIGEKMKRSLFELAKRYLPLATIRFEKDLDKKWRFMFIYSENKYQNAAEALNNHGVIGFPTETVMGLGVIYNDRKAFNNLNAIKNRPENKPYSLMLSNIKDIKKYAYISEEEYKVAKAFLPGPLTILLKKKKLPSWVTLGSKYVGIRIPDIKTVRSAIRKAGKPILAPSANISGENPALTNKEMKDIFGNKLDYIIEGDALNSKPSTIVVIDGGVKIIREGPISKEQILEVLGKWKFQLETITKDIMQN